MPKKRAEGGSDAAISRIAARQHGVVTTEQLLSAGVLPSGVTDRVKAGRLHRIYRGVYAVGHPNIGNQGRWMAAVLAIGAPAVLSHRSAAALWGILAPAQMIEVTVPGGGGRRPRHGIRLHRSVTLSPPDVTRRSTIPVTKPARTLSDLRRVLPAEQAARAVRQAEYLRLPLGDAASTVDHTRSELEARFLTLCRRHRLPQPEVNVRVDRFLVDFLWRDARLVAEVDGWDSHRTRSAFEEDRARDVRLTLLGYDVVRFTWRQVEHDSKDVATTIRRLLGR
jgi:very-short-patch-repair endonuclease